MKSLNPWEQKELSFEEAKAIFLAHKDSIRAAIDTLTSKVDFAQHPVNRELKGLTFLGAKEAIHFSVDAVVLLCEKGEVAAGDLPI